MSILDYLQEHGFTPDENGEWFDLPLGGGKVRVTFDDTAVNVHVLSLNDVSYWQVTTSDGTPASVTAIVIDQAIADAATRWQAP